MGAMRLLRKRVPVLVIGVGVVSLLTSSDWRDVLQVPSAGALAFVVFELSPFLALAFVARRLAWWAAVACTLVFGAVMVETARDVSQSSSSTASLAFLVVPVVLLVALLVVIAMSEAVRVTLIHRRGGAVPVPSRSVVGVGLLVGLVGFMTLQVFGLVMGIAVVFVVWAARSASPSDTARPG
jgi:hypothetical protein